MKVETVLPFGKLDPGLRAARDAIDLSKFFLYYSVLPFS